MAKKIQIWWRYKYQPSSSFLEQAYLQNPSYLPPPPLSPPCAAVTELPPPSNEAQLVPKDSSQRPKPDSSASFSKPSLQNPRSSFNRNPNFPHRRMGPISDYGLLRWTAEVEWGTWESFLQPTRGCQIGQLAIKRRGIQELCCKASQ
ncbi:hypothetical protein COLO4_35307 [Corchorus olitorius]|uniref:Uncharacterized protein n=1 Tax=Corchorus olitorius TaxID=93759 RepID=A0A1R3GHI9_9ROSI|nr:hypothetical protein COLO4_35307 [Corchorus olitorius]